MTGTHEPRMAAAPNDPPSEGSSGPQGASEAVEAAQDVQAATDAVEGRTAASALTGSDLRRALAFNAVGPALNERDEWLPLSVRQAVADAVLAAVDGAAPAPEPGLRARVVSVRSEPIELSPDARELVDAITPAPAPEPGLREQYAAAIHKALRDYGEGDEDPGTGSDYGDQTAVVLTVRDTELQQLRARAEKAERAVNLLADQYRALEEQLVAARSTIDRVTHLAAEYPVYIDTALIEGVLDEQEQPARCCEARIGHYPTCRTNQPQEQP